MIKPAALVVMIGLVGCGQAGAVADGGRGMDRTEAGPTFDGIVLDAPKQEDSTRGTGGSPGSDGAEADTARDGASADTSERKDVIGVIDGSSGSDRVIAVETGTPLQDAAVDAPTTALPPGPCQGTCGAVCTGTCTGKACLVTTADGKCASFCDGWCDGTCSGSCTPMGRPCGTVPDGQNCPSSSGAQYVCKAGTCTPIQPAGACVLPAGQTYQDGSYVRGFLIPGEPCPSGGGTCRGGTCCRGCWDGSACLPGDTIAACGTNGAMCQRCNWTCTVFSGPVSNPCNGSPGVPDSVAAYQPFCGSSGCYNASPSIPTCCGFSGTASCSPDAGCQ